MLFTTFEKYLTNKKGAIHVGAHEGQERFWYKQQGFSKVLWFEPNGEIYTRLWNNLQAFPEHISYNLGVHDRLKRMNLHISSNNGESSSILELGLHKQYHPTVTYIKDQVITLTRMDDFFREEKVDVNDYNFLNIDVQGVELNVIKSFGNLIEKMDYIYTEVNEAELYIGCCLVTEIDEYLKKFGFVRLATKMTKAKWGDAFYKRY